MTTHTTAPAAAFDAVAPGAGPAPILVATTGGTRSDVALGAARLLADALGAGVHVASVVAPPVVPDPQFGMLPSFPIDQPWLRACREGIEAQLVRAGVADAGWPIDVVVGEPARRLAALARTLDARLVLLGRVRHGIIHEHFGSDLAMRLLRLADVPVLAVDEGLTARPRRVVVAMDFSAYSVHAARLALELAAPDAVVQLVHVRPRFGTPFALAEALAWQHDYDAAIPGAFERAEAELADALDGRTVETVTLSGDPAQALVNYATASAADLVATGTHGRGFLDRLVLGSVAAALLQRVPCSVLCVPGSAVAHAAHRRWASAGMRVTTVPSAGWSAALAEVTRQAAGRRCSVEVDRADLGAQHLVEGVPLAGASHDPHDASVILTFGLPGRDGPTLSHVVRGVRGVDVLRDAAGTVHLLRVTDAEGQTLVTFTG